MSVDQAFDNLLNKNALLVPVASSGSPEPPPPPAPPRRPVNRRMGNPFALDPAVRQAERIPDEETDYLPRGGTENVDSVEVKNHDYPTETELASVSGSAGNDDISRAHSHGAGILGRDTRMFFAAAGDSKNSPVMDEENGNSDRYEGLADGEAGGDSSDPHLSRAKRLRRFGYLPLSGADSFEGTGRDMLASLAAISPDRPSLAITSAVRGEGRTELAIRLALAMAKRVGYKALLADFDVRKPQIAARLGVSSKRFTLAEVLRGTCALGDALVLSEEDNLYVLSSRIVDRDGDEIVDIRQAEGLFEKLHQAFDFVIIDCGPVCHADTVILCRLAGFTALAGFCGSSSLGLLHEAGVRLEASGAKIAGILLTNG
ncbi:MAG: AAA family ATPase [Planctomycetes bacterium]|nr:AAA family ATPase [Planctomycetota bacterium]